MPFGDSLPARPARRIPILPYNTVKSTGRQMSIILSIVILLYYILQNHFIMVKRPAKKSFKHMTKFMPPLSGRFYNPNIYHIMIESI